VEKSAEALQAKHARIPSSWEKQEEPKKLLPKALRLFCQQVKTFNAFTC
jgi:hypothetical protein